MTNAQLFLLSKFKQPRSVKEFENSGDWNAVLGEPPLQVIRRLVDSALLVQGDHAQVLSAKFTASQLKEMLKDRGIFAAGRKQDIAVRLVEVDPQSIIKYAAGETVFQCSEQGRLLVQQFLDKEKEHRLATETSVLNALHKNDFESASRLVASFEAEQPFPRGINIDWKNYDHRSSVDFLNAIFTCRPKIIKHVSDSNLRHLRIAAALIHLWGTSEAHISPPDDLRIDNMDRDAAARMIVFYVSYQRQLASYRRLIELRLMTIRHFEISRVGDSCSCNPCKKMATKKYSLEELPELPFEKCTSELGCRCAALPRFD